MKRTLPLKIIIALIFLTIISCSKDSDDPTETEVTVTTADFTKTMDENPANGQVIGTVSGTTNEGAVTFSITEQTPSGAFSIDPASGELKVADETLFDFETNPTISGTVKVENGSVSKNSLVTVTLNDVNEDNIFDGNIILSTQAEVNEFGTHNYIGITGYLIIGYSLGSDYSNISDLSPLQALTFVGGEIVISYNGELQTLTGLDTLSEIGSSLSIYANPNLSNIGSLRSLSVIHKSLNISSNNSLTNLNGLHNITSVSHYLEIHNIPGSNLNGLQNIRSVGSLYVSFNPNLENIDALSTITALNYNLIIQKNPLLNNLKALQNINANISQLRIIENNSLLNLEGLQNIAATYYLEISDNDSLINLSSLESNRNIDTQIIIERNDNLINLNGLENLIEVAQHFRIWQNPNLTDFCALTNLCVNGNLPSFSTETNTYNPTKQDIIDGNCSL